MLIPRGKGVSTKPIKTSYSPTAGTAYVTFDKVRVPISYTLGKVGNGMSVILTNFNHERWMVTCTSLGAQRLILEECLKLVFGVFYLARIQIIVSRSGGRISALCSESLFTRSLLSGPSWRT
jgi:Acyl-CoA dehydrogenase, C-terminal domain